jgi:hypothetical protein
MIASAAKGRMSMAGYTSFTLPSGGVVLVESSLMPPLPAEGVEQASGLQDKARATWEEGVDLVRELAEGIIAKLQAVTAAAGEVAVEFGVNFGGKTGIVLVEGNVAANLKVTIKWQGAKPDAAATPGA